jgi:hypothetical protein
MNVTKCYCVCALITVTYVTNFGDVSRFRPIFFKKTMAGLLFVRKLLYCEPKSPICCQFFAKMFYNIIHNIQPKGTNYDNYFLPIFGGGGLQFL